jgi:hypothetical protein
MKRVAVIAVVLMLAIPTVANARTPSDGWGAVDIHVAHDYWGVSEAPLCATETFTFGGSVPAGVAGQATEPYTSGTNCEMWVPPGLGVVQQCTAVVHEFGHWLGLGHTPDPREVMYSDLVETSVPSRCWRLYLIAHPRSTLADAHKAFRWTISVSVGAGY